MAAAVAVPLSAINNQLGGVLPPSALAQHNPRHGRSRGMSFKGRGRRYSVVEERDTSIAKALMFVIKRAIQEEEAKEDAEEGDGNSNSEYLVANSEGWIPVSSVLAHYRISEHSTTLSDVQRIISNAAKPRFQLRQTCNDASSSWEISRIISATKQESSSSTSPIPTGDKLTANSPDLPEFVIYETSYQRYPLLLALGGITRAPGGNRYHSFMPVTDRDSNNNNADATLSSRQNSELVNGAAAAAAEVSIYVHLPTALLEVTDSKIDWYRSENGQAIVTSDEVPKALWKKVVARRPDIGVVFEDGEVRKDLPAGLRGKAAKGKGRKADRNNLKRAGSGGEEEESDSVSEEAVE